MRDAALWLIAGLFVLAAHGAFAYLLRDIDPVPEHDAMEEAMEIDLAPIPISVPDTVQSETLAREDPVDEVDPVEETTEAVEPEREKVMEDQPETVQEAQPEEVAQAEPEEEQPAPEVAEAKPDEPEETEPEIVEQETVAAVTPEVAVPLPQPRPERKVEDRPEPPKKKPVRRKAEVTKEKPKEAARPSKRRQPPASVASAASSAPQVDPSRWNSAVRAAIARRAGAVRGMRGTVRVSFVVSASGSIVSASISGSSGNARLDRAALGMVRAARVPAPPDGLGGGRHSFAIPLTFR
jgi:protein TonB